jgi:hypothetical protein
MSEDSGSTLASKSMFMPSAIEQIELLLMLLRMHWERIAMGATMPED